MTTKSEQLKELNEVVGKGGKPRYHEANEARGKKFVRDRGGGRKYSCFF